MAASPPIAEANDNEKPMRHRKKESSRPAAVVAPFRSVVLVVHVCPKTDLEEEVVEEVVVQKRVLRPQSQSEGADGARSYGRSTAPLPKSIGSCLLDSSRLRSDASENECARQVTRMTTVQASVDNLTGPSCPEAL